MAGKRAEALLRELLELAVVHEPVLAPLEQLGDRQVLQLAQGRVLDLAFIE